MSHDDPTNSHPMADPDMTPRGDMLAANIRIAQGLLILLGTLLAGLFLTGIVAAPFDKIFGAGTRSALLCNSALQAVLAFMLPAWATARIIGPHPLRRIGATRGIDMACVAGVVLVYVFSLPAMDQIIHWNASMHLPEAWSDLEETFRKMEELNGSIGEKLMSSGSVWGLVSGVLVIGVLTGIAEEWYFRGGMQRLLTGCRVNHHVAIWVTAFVFSAMHFQFFGFFPRLLMGAWFGYLVWWTGSVWASSLAHALNNSLVVIFTWLQVRGVIDDPDMWGVAVGGFPWLALASAILTGLVIGLGHKRLFHHG